MLPPTSTTPEALLEFSMAHYHHETYCPTCEEWGDDCFLPECPLCYVSQDCEHLFTTRDAVAVVTRDLEKNQEVTTDEGQS